jgi:hypothetical protein
MTASKEGFRHRHVAVADSLPYVVEGGPRWDTVPVPARLAGGVAVVAAGDDRGCPAGAACGH